MAHDAGLTMNALCRQAGVARSTFTRAKAGETTLNTGTLNKLLAAIPDSADAA